MGLLTLRCNLTARYATRLLFPVAMLLSSVTPCRSEGVIDYNRSSLYNIYVLHNGTAMLDNIYSTVIKLGVSDRYNDHNLSLRVLFAKGHEDDDLRQQVDKFLKENQVAKRMVSKWFQRDKVSGAFSMDLIKERGNYNASVEDVILSNKTVRGKAMLEDAGEQLISNTFVIVNDVSYANKQSVGQAFGAAFEALSMVASAASISSGSSVSKVAGATSAASDLGDKISDKIAGFSVRIRSYLYQLKWNDDIAEQFYSRFYSDSTDVDMGKKNAYNLDNSLFELVYIGEYEEKSGKTVMKGIKNENEVFMKVLNRAVDENLVQLHRKFDVFKTTAPVAGVDSEGVKVHIGLKEGVESSSKFEVLERVEDAEGHISYKRKATLQPVAGKIWDNRFMASEEGAVGSDFGYTLFKLSSGGDIFPGMLVREIK